MNSPMFYLFTLILYPHFYRFPFFLYKCWKMQQSKFDYHCKNFERNQKCLNSNVLTLRKKWGNLQLALQLGFSITMIIWNSLQLNAFLGAWMHELQRMQLTIHEMYTYATCATQLQLCKINYYATLMSLLFNYHGYIMLTLLFINPSKSNTCHHWDFWMNIFFFGNINLWHPLWFILYGFRLWHMT